MSVGRLKKEIKMENNSKENVVRRFAEIEHDKGNDDATKRHKKEVVMLDTLLEIRDLLKGLQTKSTK